MFGIFKNLRSAPPLGTAPAGDRRARYLDAWRRHMPSPADLDDELLRARLAETIAWCDALTSVADLRSQVLRPSLFQDGMNDLVCDLGQNRQHQLHHRKLHVSHDTPIVANGMLMMYFPDQNLSDGYAELVSGGFFDADNVPAYDAWVSFCSEDDHSDRSARRYLLCYVPSFLISAANAGIEGNPESCIVWLEESDVSIRSRVERLTRRPQAGTNAP